MFSSIDNQRIACPKETTFQVVKGVFQEDKACNACHNPHWVPTVHFKSYRHLSGYFIGLMTTREVSTSYVYSCVRSASRWLFLDFKKNGNNFVVIC